MNLEQLSLKTIAGRIFKNKSSATTVQLINPRRDWFIGLLCGAGILVGIMVWSAYTYATNRAGDVSGDVESTTSIPTYRAAAVAEALEYFAARRELFGTLEGQVVPTPPTPTPPTSDTPPPGPGLPQAASTSVDQVTPPPLGGDGPVVPDASQLPPPPSRPTLGQ